MDSKKKRFGVEAFTLIELLVVIAVIGILTAILLPVFASVREKGRRTTCLSNMKQIELAMMAYTQDNEGLFPAESPAWDGAVFRYVQTRDVFRCPSIQVPPSLDLPFMNTSLTNLSKGYALNGSLYGANTSQPLNNPGITGARVQFPATTVALTEFAYRNNPGPPGSNGVSISHADGLFGPEEADDLSPNTSFIGPPGGERHNGGCNYAFVDGHVHWYTPAQVLSSDKPNDGSKPSFAL